MDEELRGLIEELERVQTKESGRSVLSERTCIEILYKLVKKKGLNLVTSLDGETFYTPKWLLDNIRQTVDTQGRVSTSSISRALKVPMEVVLRLTKELERDNKYVFYKNDIMTRRYIDGVFHNIGQELQDLRILELVTISQRTDLSIEFIKEEIKRRAGGTEWGTDVSVVLESNNNPLIVSNTYYSIIECMVKGALLVAKKPIRLDKIVDIRVRDASVIAKFAQGLLDKGWIRGQVVESSTFIPDTFIQKETRSLVDYFNNNGFLEIDKIKHVLWHSDSNPHLKSKRAFGWATANLSESILALDESVVISVCRLEVIRDSIIKACLEQNPGYIYISHLLPHVLTREANSSYHLDLVKLIKRLGSNPTELQECDWLFVTFDGPESFYISTLDQSSFKISLDFETYGLEDCLEDEDPLSGQGMRTDSHTVLLDRGAPNTLVFITNFGLVIHSGVIAKFQNDVLSKLETIINTMIMPYFQLLPVPASEFRPNRTRSEIQNTKQIKTFVDQLIRSHNIRNTLHSELRQEWDEIVNDNPNSTETFLDSDPHTHTQNTEADFSDLFWNLITGSVLPFVVYTHNRRMKSLFDPSNVSRTFHIEDD
ncbi:transmembrane domain-containing protein [Cryptosporidium canis]|nr:transmembrane domain-containing protein [Cryptosporidium canis]